MSKFFDWLADRIRNYIVSELSVVGDGNFRSVFAGLPEHMLDDLLRGLVSDRVMRVDVNGNEEQVVVLLPTKTDSNPDGISSGRCNQGYLVLVRNNPSIKRLLILQPPGEAQIKSVLSAVTEFGVSSAGLANAQAWSDDAFVKEILLDAAKNRDIPGDDLSGWLVDAMSKLAALDEVSGHSDVKWTVIRRLFDQPAPDVENGNFLVTFAAAGLVKPSSMEDNYGNLLGLVEAIGEFLEREGLVAGFTDLRECAEQLFDDSHEIGVINALKEFEEHVLKVAKSASEFASAALRYYCPYEENDFDGDVPSWWLTLDANTWRSLLECRPSPGSCIKVKVTNEVARYDSKGLPAVTGSEAGFEIEAARGTSRPGIDVTRRIGRQKPGKIDFIEPGFGKVSFSDSDVPSHSIPLTYTFEPFDPACKAVSIRVVVLCAFEPGYVANSRSAEKVTLPKKVQSSSHGPIFECDLELDGQGVHQVDIHACSGFLIEGMVYGYGVTTDDDDESEITVTPVQVADGRWSFDAETDEECHYEFDYVLPGGEKARARLNLRAGDVESTGASSEFHRLILKASRGQSARVILRESQLIYTLQRWMLTDKHSYRPLLLSPSFEGNCDKPDWEGNPRWSEHPPVYDPRPDASEFTPPVELVETRNMIAQRIIGEQDNGICERATLGKLYMQDDNFHTWVDKYVEHYAEWLKNDYTSAALFDTVFACFYQRDSEVLQPVPVAVLLSPLHPARLGWQVTAQCLLVDALNRGIRCPGASVIDPTSLPDSIALPVVKAQGDTEFVPFVSIPCNSDYWAVLWNAEELDKIGGSEARQLFGEELGLILSGLSAGFSAAQVKRAMQEIFDVNSGRSRLRVRLLSDVEGESNADDGINSWALEHLGSEDLWKAAARTSIDVFDARRDGQRPAEPFVANLTSRTQGAARWLVDKRADAQDVDLSLITHLKRITPEHCSMGAHSAASLGSLTRERVCYRLPATGGRMVGETRTLPSRLCPVTLAENIDGLASSVELIDWHLESAMVEHCSCNGISFAPNLPTLERGLEASAYCAVSSTDIDPSAFLRPQHDSYLWDYDLPSYAGKAQDNVGYYLLAQHSAEIENQVKHALALLGGTNLDSETTRKLLSEISRRGLPSLKELASGGSSATGEVGLLVACRLLQGPPDEEGNVPKLLPVIAEEGQVINLLLPVDPFTAQFDDLRKALKADNFQRPDLLVASIRFDGDEPVVLRLTPIEVKARTSAMSAAARHAALEQARSFARFLSRLLEKRDEEPIWNLAVAKLMATWFSFGFRVYGEMMPIGFRDNLIKSNAAVNQALLRGQLECEVDMRGRLVVTHEGATSRASDLDGDGFEETVMLKPGDALGIVVSPGNSNVLHGMVERVSHWDLLAPPVKETSDDPSPEPAVHEPPATGTLGENGSAKSPGTPAGGSVQPGESVAKPSTAEAIGEKSTEPMGIRFNIGTTLDSFREEWQEFFPGNTGLTQLNIGIVGNLGTGKTQLTQTLIYQVYQGQRDNFNRKPFFLIFDYKRDYDDPEFVEALDAKIIKPRRIPINIFDTSTVPGESPAWLERSNFLCDILAKIYSGIGPVQRENLKQSVKSAYQVAELNGKTAPTLTDVFAEYRQLVNKPDSVFSILSDMVDMELFEEDAGRLVPFSDYLDGVVVVDLASLGQNDNTKNMLVVLFLNLFYENMLRLEKFPFVGSDPQLRTINGFLLVDEADNIMRYQFPVLQNVLLQGREFGVGVLLASQYLSHFKPDARTNYKEPLLTWFIHQVPSVTVNDLKGIGLIDVDSGMVSRIQGLGKHECLYKSLNVDGEFICGIPFYVLRNWGSDEDE